jgi:hypothetical protein
LEDLLKCFFHHKLALKEIHRRKKNKTIKTNILKIKQYAFWILLVTIAVFIVILAHLPYIYVIQLNFVQQPPHVTNSHNKNANKSLPQIRIDSVKH